MDDDIFTIKCNLEEEDIEVKRKVLMLRFESVVIVFHIVLTESTILKYSYSPVLRNAIELMPNSASGADRTITLQEEFSPLSMLLLLLSDLEDIPMAVALFKWDAAWVYLEAIELADKYDVPWVPRLMKAHMWDVAAETDCSPELALIIFNVAYEMKWASLARQAIPRMSGLDEGWPPGFSADTARDLGLDAWHCLVSAANLSKRDDWKALARRANFPRG